MLALERRPQLAALRALGLRRHGLVGLAVTECLLYGWAGALAGAAAGALMGRVLAGGVADIFAAYLDGRSDAPFRYELRPVTLLAGAAAGTVLTLAVAAVAARRTGRLDIAAGLRDTPDPPAADVRAGRGRQAARLLATAVLVGAGVALLVPPYLPRLAGGVVLVLVAGRLARRALPVRPRVSLAALAVAAWSVVQLAGSSPDDDAAGWVGLFVAAVLVTSFALTVLVAANLDLAELAVGVLGGASARTAAILKPALAYPARRPVRTGLTAGVFAVVVAVLTEFAVLEGGAGSADPGREASGFDVVVRTPGTQAPPLADGVRGEVDRSLVLPVRTYVGPLGSDDPFAGAERAVLPLVRVAADLAEHPPFRLAARDPRFPDDAAAWRAVAADPTLAISASGAVGETVALRGDAGPVGLTVVGTPPDELLGGVFVSGATLERFRTAAPGVLRLLDVRPGADVDRVAADAGAAVAGVGGQAGTIAAELDRTARANRAWVDMLGLLMRLGLLVGVVGLSIVSLRTARERRPLVGMLRALGWTRRQVVAGLLVESTVVTTLGTAVGVVTGLVTGWALARTDGTAAGIAVDVPALAGTVAVIHLAALAVTVLPTRRAGGFPPAAALRATG
jgi:putative ABC transport system permease protein